MGLAIFLRKRLSPNYFRELLIDSLKTGLGNEVLLCSGFFQEKKYGNYFSVSTEGSFSTLLKKHNIKLKTVGIHNDSWLADYKNFRDNLLKSGVSIHAKISPNYKWHAKIFILKNNGKPIFGIVGSSNMTRPAFGTSSPFNFEADVVMWLDEYKELNSIFNNTISQLNQSTNEVIIADYNPRNNFELSIEDRLRQLNDDVEESELIDLE